MPLQSIRHEIMIACTSTRHWSRTDNEHSIQLVEYKAPLIECVEISFHYALPFNNNDNRLRCTRMRCNIHGILREFSASAWSFNIKILVVSPVISRNKTRNATCILHISLANPITMNPVYNDHLMQYFSAFRSSPGWPRATEMSSRRQKLLAGINWYLQASLKHITELITGNKSYYRGGRYRQVSLHLSKILEYPLNIGFWLQYAVVDFLQEPIRCNLFCAIFPRIDFVAST